VHSLFSSVELIRDSWHLEWISLCGERSLGHHTEGVWFIPLIPSPNSSQQSAQPVSFVVHRWPHKGLITPNKSLYQAFLSVPRPVDNSGAIKSNKKIKWTARHLARNGVRWEGINVRSSQNQVQNVGELATMFERKRKSGWNSNKAGRGKWVNMPIHTVEFKEIV